MQVSKRTRRVLKIVGWVVLGLLLAVYIGFPVVMGVAAVWPSRAAVGAPPAGFTDVTFRTTDNVEIAGWYAPPKNGGAIILAHGAGESREAMRSLAVMLAEHGYGVLAIDVRGHGKSGGTTNRLGWQGTADVRAAVDFLGTQEGVDTIGAVGSSMGGEIVLGASAACPEIRAIVADGATHRSAEELLSLPEKRPIEQNIVARLMFLTVGTLTGEKEPAPLLDEMKRSGSTTFLLIAAGNVADEVRYNELFAREVGGRTELWVAPEVGHVGAYSRYSEEYEARLLMFFDLWL